ncbi:MAG: hypothetical protein WB607_08100 [Candidatus Acidiferrum sp.]
MSEYHVKMQKNLDKVLFDDVGETPAEVRQRLEREGVDVKGLVARVKMAAGTAYRELLAEQAKEEQSRTAKSKGHIFGNLVGLGRDKLLELIDAAARGQFGAEVMARCRNQDAEKLSEDDLRTLLEDIESTIRE